MTSAPTGTLHHVELWVPDLARARRSWGWLLEALGYRRFQEWGAGASWRLGATYVVVEQSGALSARKHDRLRPGLNHLAFHVAARGELDALVAASGAAGWGLLYPERHAADPARGAEYEPGVYAAYLVDADGFEVELVAA